MSLLLPFVNEPIKGKAVTGAIRHFKNASIEGKLHLKHAVYCRTYICGKITFMADYCFILLSVFCSDA